MAVRPATIAVAIALMARAGLAGPAHLSPPVACQLLAPSDLPAGTWKPLFDDHYFCVSAVRRIGPVAALPNNISYHVNGRHDTVETIKVVLNVNLPAYATSAHPALLALCDTLSKRVLSSGVPADVRDSLLEGYSASHAVGTGTLRIIRDDWPTGRGYSMACVIE